jgi:hypothetical protein
MRNSLGTIGQVNRTSVSFLTKKPTLMNLSKSEILLTVGLLCALSLPMASYAQPNAPAGWRLSTAYQNTTYVTVGAENAIISVTPPLPVKSLDLLVTRATNLRASPNCGSPIVEKASQIEGIQAQLVPMAAGAKYQCSLIALIRPDGQGQVLLLFSQPNFDHAQQTEPTAIVIAQQLATSQGNVAAQSNAPSASRGASPSKTEPPVDPRKANDVAIAMQILAPMLDKNGEAVKGIKSADIDSIRFDMFDVTSIRPLILLKNNIVCDCAEFNFDELNLVAVARKSPNDIGQWRIEGGKIQIKWTKSKNWSGLSFPNSKGKPLGDNWKGSGTYKRITSSGYGMPGGDNSASTFVSTMLTFSPDGRFSEGNVVSSTVEGGGSRTVAGGQTAAKSGRYKVEGWTLVLTYDNGKVERSTAITDNDPSAFWLGGKGYVR